MGDKKTILVVCSMFAKDQTILAIDKGQVIEKASVTIDKISEAVNTFANQYDIKTVNIKGAKMFTKKIGNIIQEEGISKYNKNLIINLIK